MFKTFSLIAAIATATSNLNLQENRCDICDEYIQYGQSAVDTCITENCPGTVNLQGKPGGCEH